VGFSPNPSNFTRPVHEKRFEIREVFLDVSPGTILSAALESFSLVRFPTDSTTFHQLRPDDSEKVRKEQSGIRQGIFRMMWREREI